MEYKEAVKVANIIYDIDKVEEIQETVLGILEGLDILVIPTHEIMKEIETGITKVFTNITEELHKKLKEY